MGSPRRRAVAEPGEVVLAGAMACGAATALRKAIGPRPVRVTEVLDYDEATIERLLRTAVAIVTPLLKPTMLSSASNLRLVQCTGAGIDRLAISSLPAGVSVANCSGHAQAIAEYVVGTALILVRGLLAADRALRRGDWSFAGFSPREAASDLRGRTAVVLGAGGAVPDLVRLLASHGAATVVVSRDAGAARRRVGDAHEFRTIDELDDLLPRADLLVVAVPLNSATKLLLSDDRLARLPSHAVLINVSRGGIVDEASLYRRLARRQIAAAAIDVWDNEPLDWRSRTSASRLPFERLDNVLMTPHLAGWSQATRAARHACMIENVIRLLDGGALQNVVVVT